MWCKVEVIGGSIRMLLPSITLLHNEWKYNKIWVIDTISGKWLILFCKEDVTLLQGTLKKMQTSPVIM